MIIHDQGSAGERNYREGWLIKTNPRWQDSLPLSSFCSKRGHCRNKALHRDDASAREDGPTLNNCLHTSPASRHSRHTHQILPPSCCTCCRHWKGISDDMWRRVTGMHCSFCRQMMWNQHSPKLQFTSSHMLSSGLPQSLFCWMPLLKHVTSYEKEDPEFVSLMLRSSCVLKKETPVPSRRYLAQTGAILMTNSSSFRHRWNLLMD